MGITVPNRWRTEEAGQALPFVPGWVVAVSVLGTVAIGSGAFFLSATNQAQAALSAFPPERAWVWPLIVDGMIVVGTVAVVALRPYGRRAVVFPWCLLIVGSIVSVMTNSYSAVNSTGDAASAVAAGLIAAVPPLVLLAMTHLTVELARRSRRRSAPGVVVTGPPRHAAGAPAAALLRQAGYTNRQIAEQLGIHPSTVGRWLTDGERDGDEPGNQFARQ